jgi:hypothetical protein
VNASADVLLPGLEYGWRADKPLTSKCIWDAVRFGSVRSMMWSGQCHQTTRWRRGGSARRCFVRAMNTRVADAILHSACETTTLAGYAWYLEIGKQLAQAAIDSECDNHEGDAKNGSVLSLVEK